jgi:cytochrome c oxidase assembly protein subunit 15
MPSATTQIGRTTYAGLGILTDNPLVVHFIHRTLGYVLFLLIILWAMQVAKAARAMSNRSVLARWWQWPVVLVVSQVVLGIITVLLAPKAKHNGFGPWELVAQAHQLVAMALLLALVAVVFATSPTTKRTEVGQD